MSNLDVINAAIEKSVDSLITASTAPIQAALDTANTALAAAQAQVAADATAAAALQAKVDALTAQVADLQKQLDAAQHPVTPVAPTPGLWFKVPDDIASHDRKVFAHYFGPFPRSMDNKSPESADYYSTGYLAPGGEGGKWAQYGGYLRNRPIYRAPISGAWQVADCTFDIDVAVKAGLDGFMCDLLGMSGSNFQNYENLKTAAQAYNTAHGTHFYVVPMVDTAGATAQADPVTAGNYVATFAGLNCSWYNADGKFVISSFRAETNPTTWWAAMMAQVTAKTGKQCAFLAAFLDISKAAAFTSVTWGEGNWGDGDDPLIQQAATNNAAPAHSRGKVWMGPVGGQNVRPDQVKYDEACNTAAQRASWDKAIRESADFVQMVTWSDYSEGTEYAPSEARGYAPVDLAAWYIVKLKTGDFPTILKDEIILSHRSNPVASKPSGGQTQTMQHWVRGFTTSAPRDTIEALVFLTAPATVVISVAGQTDVTFQAPAGMSSWTAPLGFAAISAKVIRAGQTTASVASVVTPVKVPVRDDKQYFWFSSERGTAGQKAPYGP